MAMEEPDEESLAGSNTDAGIDAEVKAESTKKASSYTYWVRNSDMAGAPAAVPKKLTASEVVTEKGQQPTHLGSRWNQAGTWEEKCLNSWAWSRVKELLAGIEPLHFEEGTVRVLEVSSCSGDATLVTVRQKKRVGYSFEIEMKYTMNVKKQGEGEEDEGKKDVEGKMKVTEACYGELDDLQLEVNVSSKDVSDSVLRKKITQSLVSLFLPEIRCKLEQFEAELKER